MLIELNPEHIREYKAYLACSLHHFLMHAQTVSKLKESNSERSTALWCTMRVELSSEGERDACCQAAQRRTSPFWHHFWTLTRLARHWSSVAIDGLLSFLSNWSIDSERLLLSRACSCIFYWIFGLEGWESLIMSGQKMEQGVLSHGRCWEVEA